MDRIINENITRLIDEMAISQAELPDLIAYLSGKVENAELLSNSKDLSSILQSKVDELLTTGPAGFLVESGFFDFDQQFNGFSEGELVVVGGRPAMGKTMMMISMTLNMSTKHQVCFYSFDLSEQNLIYRFISALSEIPVQNIINLKENKEAEKKLLQASEKIRDKKIQISCPKSRYIEDLTENIHRDFEDKNCRIFVIDNLQSLQTKVYYKRRDLELGFILAELKSIANKLNCVIIISSQLNRSVEYRGGSKRPMMADLRDSGNIEQDADKIILIHCPEYYGYTVDENHQSLKGIMILEMAKNRNGALGSTFLVKNKGNTHVHDLTDEDRPFILPESRLKDFDDILPF